MARRIKASARFQAGEEYDRRMAYILAQLHDAEKMRKAGAWMLVLERLERAAHALSHCVHDTKFLS